jgi:hypothetical protein
MRKIDTRKTLSVVVLLSFFLTSIPGYAKANTIPPANYEQAKLQEFLEEIGFDPVIMKFSATPELNESIQSVLNEFSDAKELLATTPHTSWTEEIIQQAILMIANRLEGKNLAEYAENLGLTPYAQHIYEKLLKLDKWLKQHPDTCATIVALTACLVFVIIMTIMGCIASWSPLTATIAILIIAFISTEFTGILTNKLCHDNPRP